MSQEINRLPVCSHAMCAGGPAMVHNPIARDTGYGGGVSVFFGTIRKSVAWLVLLGGTPDEGISREETEKGNRFYGHARRKFYFLFFGYGGLNAIKNFLKPSREFGQQDKNLDLPRFLSYFFYLLISLYSN